MLYTTYTSTSRALGYDALNRVVTEPVTLDNFAGLCNSIWKSAPRLGAKGDVTREVFSDLYANYCEALSDKVVEVEKNRNRSKAKSPLYAAAVRSYLLNTPMVLVDKYLTANPNASLEDRYQLFEAFEKAWKDAVGDSDPVFGNVIDYVALQPLILGQLFFLDPKLIDVSGKKEFGSFFSLDELEGKSSGEKVWSQVWHKFVGFMDGQKGSVLSSLDSFTNSHFNLSTTNKLWSHKVANWCLTRCYSDEALNLNWFKSTESTILDKTSDLWVLLAGDTGLISRFEAVFEVIKDVGVEPLKSTLDRLYNGYSDGRDVGCGMYSLFKSHSENSFLNRARRSMWSVCFPDRKMPPFKVVSGFVLGEALDPALFDVKQLAGKTLMTNDQFEMLVRKVKDIKDCNVVRFDGVDEELSLVSTLIFAYMFRRLENFYVENLCNYVRADVIHSAFLGVDSAVKTVTDSFNRMPENDKVLFDRELRKLLKLPVMDLTDGSGFKRVWEGLWLASYSQFFTSDVGRDLIPVLLNLSYRSTLEQLALEVFQNLGVPEDELVGFSKFFVDNVWVQFCTLCSSKDDSEPFVMEHEMYESLRFFYSDWVEKDHSDDNEKLKKYTDIFNTYVNPSFDAVCSYISFSLSMGSKCSATLDRSEGYYKSYSSYFKDLLDSFVNVDCGSKEAMVQKCGELGSRLRRDVLSGHASFVVRFCGALRRYCQNKLKGEGLSPREVQFWKSMVAACDLPKVDGKDIPFVVLKAAKKAGEQSFSLGTNFGNFEFWKFLCNPSTVSNDLTDYFTTYCNRLVRVGYSSRVNCNDDKNFPVFMVGGGEFDLVSAQRNILEGLGATFNYMLDEQACSACGWDKSANQSFFDYFLTGDSLIAGKLEMDKVKSVFEDVCKRYEHVPYASLNVSEDLLSLLRAQKVGDGYLIGKGTGSVQLFGNAIESCSFKGGFFQEFLAVCGSGLKPDAGARSVFDFVCSGFERAVNDPALLNDAGFKAFWKSFSIVWNHNKEAVRSRLNDVGNDSSRVSSVTTFLDLYSFFYRVRNSHFGGSLYKDSLDSFKNTAPLAIKALKDIGADVGCRDLIDESVRLYALRSLGLYVKSHVVKGCVLPMYSVGLDLGNVLSKLLLDPLCAQDRPNIGLGVFHFYISGMLRYDNLNFWTDKVESDFKAWGDKVFAVGSLDESKALVLKPQLDPDLA